MVSVPLVRSDRRDQLRSETVKNCDQMWYFHYDRIVDAWNKLDDKRVEGDTLN